MIRNAEGTAGRDGYRTLFGGGLFDDYSDHPRRKVTATLGGRQITSTAAGAYQFLAGTWDEARAALSLPDFSPASQDQAAAWLIRRRGALTDVYAGRLDTALAKCAKEWASLPGSPYGQPTISSAKARQLFADAGGTYA
ncbi:glycoside hydrolase family protein [Rhodocyclus tenuis]|uniref:Glycoside hydrolase family protein n=1 Tax=Rhodocyclus tenuis TaxID=1066 RepID=A0A6L5JUC7_RHOTE|nr:glycoside hydrolase family protein [Rhodocyclus gracilis]